MRKEADMTNRIILLLALLIFSATPVAARDVWHHLQQLGSHPDRSVGSDGEHHAAKYISTVFASLEKKRNAVVGRQFFRTPVRSVQTATLTIADRTIPIPPLYANSLSPEATPEDGRRGALVYVGRGTPEEFDHKPIEGNIILMDLDSRDNWEHAASLGAVALIYLDHGNEAFPRLRFQDKEELTPVDFPRFWLEYAEFVKNFGPPQQLGAQPATLVSHSSWHNQPAENQFCYIPGLDAEKQDEVLILEAFYDSSRYIAGRAPGADEAVSIATLLTLAEDFLDRPPRHPVLLLATSGHANNLTGLREVVWALVTKKKDIRAELQGLQNQAEEVAATGMLLAQGHIGSSDKEKNRLLNTALRSELRDEIEKINHALQLARRADKSTSKTMKQLSERKLLLRRLSWASAFHSLSPPDREQIREFLPTALSRNERLSTTLSIRIEELTSSLSLNKLVTEKRVSAAISLHLSSHGGGIGSVSDGFLFELVPTVNRSRLYTYIRPLLSQSGSASPLNYVDLLGGAGRNHWFNFFPDQPALGGELTALAGFPGFTLATVDDMRTTWSTPYDTLDQVDRNYVQEQAVLVRSLIAQLTENPLPEPPFKQVNGFSTLTGNANFLRQGELFPERTAENVLLQIYQDKTYTRTWVDSLGTFRLPGLADRKHSFGKAIIEGYRYSSGANRASWAIDKPATGKDRYRVKLNRKGAQTDLIMFGCSQTTLFGLRDARRLTPLTRIQLIDSRTETEPLHYWYSRIDSRHSQLVSLFLEPDTPFKVTLSDTVLEQRMLLLNNDRADMLGRGFIAADVPAVLNTPLQAAKDMVQLIEPRVQTLESHSIVNQRIRSLLSQARSHLDTALVAHNERNYSIAAQQAKASLAAAARVYNDVERTQKDVLTGVLFYIALFVPFAYCLERLLFGFVSINKRLIAFLSLLLVVITIIYFVHPAFQLTYSPMVVVLAFFILGISFLVSLILFNRFEQEMKQLQSHAHVSAQRSISLWGAFVAAFSIGVTNLRRRKVRTALTCATLVILTYTLLNFTTVRHVQEQGRLAYRDTSPYQGIMLKAPDWKTLPGELTDNLHTLLPNWAVLRRVWWETANRTRPPAIALQYDHRAATANSLIGLDQEAIRLSIYQKSLLAGGWFNGNGDNQILLSGELAEELGVKFGTNPAQVLLWGVPFIVQGIFDGTSFGAQQDLDGEVQTPVIYPNEASSELSEAEAEAAESGQDIVAMSSRYQHMDGRRSIILPAKTLLQLGGSLKSLTILPAPGNDMHQIAGKLADRYQLLVYHGAADTTWLHYSTSTLNYNGMANVAIPSLIAILIVLNTMISSVVERKREIGVYISVGLAPPHVSSLFVAEALAFGIISSVIGYLGAQVGAHFLAGTPLWSGMTANYSSLAGIGAMLAVMAVVLLSVIYPSRVAGHIAVPDVTKNWTLPKAEGSSLTLTLPFLIKIHEQDQVAGFLASYYQSHQDISHGHFSTDDIAVEYSCPIDLGHTGHPDCFNLNFRTWLAPFDFGIRQQVHLTACPSPAYQEFLEIRIRLTREVGEKNTWFRLCRSFINDLRKQLLIWRSLDLQEKKSYEQTLQLRLRIPRLGEVT